VIDALIAGRLYGKPAARTAKNGSAFAVGKIRVGTRDGGALFVSVIAFSASAVQALLTLDDGDSVALAGELTPKAWIDKNGEPRPQLDMLCHAVLSPYHVKRKREAIKPANAERDSTSEPVAQPEAPSAAQQPAGGTLDFDDEIPF
jgi:single-stranded DNA-binding protein